MNNAESAFELWARKEGWIPSHRGWPDYLCRRGAEVMCVEVKDKSDWLSTDQRAALIDLHALGIPTFIWTPTERLMAYPKVQNEALLARIELAYELEQAKIRVDEVEVAKQQLHAQLSNTTAQLEKSYKYHTLRRTRFGKDFRALLDWARAMPDVPVWVHEMLQKYPGALDIP